MWQINVFFLSSFTTISSLQAKTVWTKQLQQWTIEILKVSCKKLMQQVLEMRKKQIEYKCELLSLVDICWQEISVASLNLSSPTVSVLAT